MKSLSPTAKEELKELLDQGTLWSGERTSSPLSAMIHEELPGLSFGAIHEWSLKEQLGGRYSFHPPLLILCAALRSALKRENAGRTILWIGERCWPTVPLLEKLSEGTGWSWRKNSILINSSSKDQRVYALRKALASPAVLAVIGDGSGLNATATRQLQLSVRTGSSLGLLIRPDEELAQTSCAQTKWSVQPHLSESQAARRDRLLAYTGTPQWKVALLRAPGLIAPRSWLVEWDEEQFGLRSFGEELSSQEQVPAEKVAHAL